MKTHQLRSTVLLATASAVFLNLVQAVKLFNETYEAMTKAVGSFGISALHQSTMLGIFVALGVLAVTLFTHREALKDLRWAVVVGIIVLIGTAINLVATELHSPEPRLQEKIKSWAGTIQKSVFTNGRAGLDRRASLERSSHQCPPRSRFV